MRLRVHDGPPSSAPATTWRPDPSGEATLPVPFDGYVEFWGGFGEIVVEGEPAVDEAAGTVTVRLRLDGSTESYALELVAGDGGELLVDGPRPR